MLKNNWSCPTWWRITPLTPDNNFCAQSLRLLCLQAWRLVYLRFSFVKYIYITRKLMKRALSSRHRQISCKRLLDLLAIRRYIAHLINQISVRKLFSVFARDSFAHISRFCKESIARNFCWSFSIFMTTHWDNTITCTRAMFVIHRLFTRKMFPGTLLIHH